MKLTLLLLAPLAAYASNDTTAAATTAAGNGTAATAAATAGATAAATTKAAGNTTATAAAGTTKAAAAAGTTKAAAAAGTTGAPAASSAAGNTTAASATDKKIKITIPEVKVSVDTSVLTTATLKTAAAKAIFDGVAKEAGNVEAGGKLYAKYDAFFGATDTPGYAAARRSLASHMKETKNDFKYVVTVPAAAHAAKMTAMNTKLKTAATFSEASLVKSIGDAFTKAGNLGNATVKFAKPANMAAQDATPAAGGTTTSGAAAATGLVAMVFTGLAALF